MNADHSADTVKTKNEEMQMVSMKENVKMMFADTGIYLPDIAQCLQQTFFCLLCFKYLTM